MLSWRTIMQKLILNPGAVCRQILANLRTYPQLSQDEERRIIHAIESSGVPDATSRVLASLSRNTINEILGDM